MQDIILRTTGPRGRAEWFRLAFAIVFVALVLFTQLFLALNARWGMPWEWDWREVADALALAWQNHPLRIEMFVFGAVVPLAIWLGPRALDQRLELGAQGIRFSTRLPDLAKTFQPDWQISWSELSRVSYGRRHPIAKKVPVTLVFHAGERRQEVSTLLPWRPEGTRASASGDGRFHLSAVGHLEKAFARSALVSALEERGVLIDPGGETYNADGLRKSKAGIALSTITIACIAYAVFEIAFLTDTYVSPPWFELGAFGFFAALASGVLSRGMELNLKEKTVLPVLVGLAVACAAYFGTLRLNLVLDGQQATLVEYRLDDKGFLRPEVSELPLIDIRRYSRVRRDMQSDTWYPVQIRKGGLGFYQFDISHLRQSVRLQNLPGMVIEPEKGE